MFQYIARALLAAFALVLASCAHRDRIHVVRVSVPDQKMVVFRKGVEVARYDISTSKFGVGGRAGSYTTPLGEMEVARKIGSGARSGMKFRSRRPTGEIVAPNSPGRDPIVTRILWLRGLERQNRDAYARCIYIHGTAEEWRIGTAASYGCIRMRSPDVIQLFDTIGVGARVVVTMAPFPTQIVQNSPPAVFAPTAAPTPAPAPAPARANHAPVKQRKHSAQAPPARNAGALVPADGGGRRPSAATGAQPAAGGKVSADKASRKARALS